MKKYLYFIVLCLFLGGQTYAQLTSNLSTGVIITVVDTIAPTTCGGSDGSIEVSGGNQYSWDNGQNTATATGLSAGNYTVTVTNSYGCDDDSTITLSGPAYPVITGDPQSTSTCEGAMISLSITATGNNLTFQWYKNTYILVGFTDSVYTIPSATTADAGNYTCDVTSGTCTVTSGTAVVLVAANPTADAGTDQYINYGDAVTIGSGSVSGCTYVWSPATDLSNANVSNPIATPTSSETYVVTVTNVYGCTATDAVNIIVTGTSLAASVTASPSTICNGGSSVLTSIVVGGSGSYTYSWSNGGTTSSITVTPTTTTAYTLTVSDGSQTTTASAIVTIDTPPTANAGSDQTITLGDTTTIGSSAIGGNTYSWSSYPSGFSSTSAQPQVIPTVTTVYTVTVTSSAGCTATDDVTVFVTGGGTLVFVDPIEPIISAAGTTITEGDATQLTTLVSGGTPPYTYLWSPSTGLSSVTIYNPVATPLIITTYSVTITDGASLTLSASLTITVLANDPPTASIGAGTQDQTICLGDDLTLNVTLTGEAPWTITYGDGSSSWNATTSDSLFTLVVTPSAPGSFVYSITNVVDDNFSSGSTSGYALITVNASPSVSLGSDQAMCAGNSVSLSDQSGGSYSYYLWSTGDTTSGILTATPTATTTYWLQVTNSTGCSATDTMVITVNQVPSINAGADQAICEGDSATLTATGGVSYSWSPGAMTGATATVGPTTSTLFTITGYNSFGCQATDQVNVFVNPLPAAYAGADQTICKGSSATLNATGGGTYGWSTGDSTSSISVTPTATTVYTVTVISSQGCTATDQISIIVSEIPTVDAGSDESICDGNSVPFSITSTGATIFSWSPITGLSDANIANPIASPTSSTTYTVLASNTAGCFVSDQITVTVSRVPVITSSDVFICEGDTIQLNTSADVTGCSFSWTPSTGLSDANVANPTVTLTATTTYSLLATSPDLCVGVKTITVTVNPVPVAEFSAYVYPDSTGSVDFTNASTDATTYLWDFGDGNTSVDEDPLYTYTASGNYNVWLTATNSCGSDMISNLISGVIAIYSGIGDTPGEAISINLYPNPAREFVTLTGIENIEEIRFYDILGQTLITTKVPKGESQVVVDLSGFASGLYYVDFTTSKGNSITERIVKL